MKSIVITGVSSGIGHAAAADLLARGYHVFGSVRKQDDADRVQAEFGDSFTPLLFDVTDPDGIRKAAERVAALLGGDSGLAGLVNNAGITSPGPLVRTKGRAPGVLARRVCSDEGASCLLMAASHRHAALAR